MIEITFYYLKVDGNWYRGTKNFNDTDKAIRFIYKCLRSSKLVFSGEINCEDDYDLEIIRHRFWYNF